MTTPYICKTPQKNQEKQERLIIGLVIALCISGVAIVSMSVLFAHKFEGLLKLDSTDIVCVDMSGYRDDTELDNKTS